MTPNTKTQVEYSHPATDGAQGSKITLCGITIAAGSWGTEEQADAMGVEYTDCPDCAAMKHLEEEAWPT